MMMTPIAVQMYTLEFDFHQHLSHTQRWKEITDMMAKTMAGMNHTNVFRAAGEGFFTTAAHRQEAISTMRVINTKAILARS